MALDSTLKTQMFLTETQRQTSLDLANRINEGFTAAAAGVQFSSQVSQAMVQSAANFKQIEIDEWYKGEQLKMEMKRLALAEQAAKDRVDFQNRQLDLRAKQMEGKKRSDEEKEVYNEFISDVVLDASEIEANLDEIGSVTTARITSNSKLSSDEDLIKKQFENKEINEATRDYQLRLISQQKSDNNTYIAQSLEKRGTLQAELRRRQALIDIAKIKGKPLDELKKQFDSIRGVSPPVETGSPITNITIPNFSEPFRFYQATPTQPLSVEDVSKNTVTDVSGETVGPPDLSTKIGDIMSFVNGSRQWDEQYVLREIKNVNQEDVKKKSDEMAGAAVSLFSELINADSDTRKVVSDESKDSFQILDRWNKVDPNKSISSSAIKIEAAKSDNRIRERYISIVAERNKLPNETVEDSKAKARSEFEQRSGESWRESPEGQQAINDEVNNFRSRYLGIPIDPGTGKPELRPPGPMVPDPSFDKNVSRVNEYINDLGGNSIEAISSRDSEGIVRAANALESYEREFNQAAKLSEEQLAKKLVGLSDRQIGYVNLYDIGVDYNKDRGLYITQLIKSGRAIEILAASFVNKKDLEYGKKIRRDGYANQRS